MHIGWVHALQIVLGTLYLTLCVCVEDPVDFVNLLAGTFTDGNSFSTGNTLPLVGYPWGFNHWAPQTRENSRQVGSWWFRGNEHRFTWFRCTHQPSPWIGDWGWFLFTPILGGGRDVTRNPTYFWEPRSATIKPHYFDATLAPDGVRLEVTPSMHGAMARITFPKAHNEKRMCFTGIGAQWKEHGMSDTKQYSPSASSTYEKKISTGSGKPYLKGKADQVHIERLIVANFNMHVRAESDDAVEVEDHQDLACFRFDAKATTVTVYIATSMISEAQVVINLNRELRYVNEDHSENDTKLSMGPTYSDKQFSIVKDHAHKTWNDLLSRVDVVDAGHETGSHMRQLSIFYSGLMRALAFPRRTDEVNLQGEVVHYSPYSPSGGIFKGPGCTDNGFWDTFRTVYPMLSLLYPDHLAQIVDGWLNAYREGGWLPSWASPGYRNCMVGTFADVVVSDAIVKNIKGFDLKVARGAITKDSFEEPPRYAGNAIGKEGLKEYESIGYIAQDPRNRGIECVSRTLDFGFADMAVANALKTIANSEIGQSDADIQMKIGKLAQRADRAVRSLFKKTQGLFVPKSKHGEFSSSFRDKEWGNGYTEGNAWHHSFPPYAVNADTGGILAQLHGGKSQLLAKLHELLETSGNYSPGSYGQEIHEMLEARAVAMGQYAHNNQPVHHILWLFALLGDRKTTETSIRFVLHHAYGVDFFAGDEDNGEQGAWYVLSALGLFATTPGTPFYEVGSPIFKHVRIARTPKPMTSARMTGNSAVGYSQVDASDITGGMEKFTDIVALGTSDEAVHVTKLQWNDGDVPKDLHHGTEDVPATLHNSLLMRDGVLRFTMEGETANLPFDRTATGPAIRVASASSSHKAAPRASNSNSGNGGISAAENAKLVKEKRASDTKVAELEALLLQTQTQVRLQKTVVSQLQEKLTHNGLDSKLNMTHIEEVAKKHVEPKGHTNKLLHLEEEVIFDTINMMRKVDHSDTDAQVLEHFIWIVMIICVFVLWHNYRSSVQMALRGPKEEKNRA